MNWLRARSQKVLSPLWVWLPLGEREEAKCRHPTPPPKLQGKGLFGQGRSRREWGLSQRSRGRAGAECFKHDGWLAGKGKGRCFLLSPAVPAPASMHFLPGLDALATLGWRPAEHQATCVELMGSVVQPQKVVNHGGLANAPGSQEEHHWLGSNLSVCRGKGRAAIWNKTGAALEA